MKNATKYINFDFLYYSFVRAVAQLGRASESPSKSRRRRRCRRPPMVGAVQPTKRTGVMQKPECRRFKSCPPDILSMFIAMFDWEEHVYS